MNISNQPRNHNYSRPIDVHLTCNHSETTELVKVIFNKYFDNLATKSIKPCKRNLFLLKWYNNCEGGIINIPRYGPKCLKRLITKVHLKKSLMLS